MRTNSWELESDRIISFYSYLIEEHGIDIQALDWGNPKSQELRFTIFEAIGQLNEASILDVGCGTADFLCYLQKRNINAKYTGYDITPAMIEYARHRFPNANLEVRDLLTEPGTSAKFDYVLASGIFYLRQLEPMIYLETMIHRMFSLCRHGVAFNTLSSLAHKKTANEFYAEPAEVLAICLKVTPRVVLRHDYLIHDFTVYLYKEEE